MGKPENLSYCTDFVRQRDHDRFLRGLFVPDGPREALFALCALNAELAQVRSAVSEDMLGHIRLAWWQEGIDALHAGQPPRPQPVLQALAPVIGQGNLPPELLQPLLDAYREHFPHSPPCLDRTMETVSLHLLRSLCPGREAGWQKAGEVIAAHRARFGTGWNGWLSIKLLLAGR